MLSVIYSCMLLNKRRQEFKLFYLYSALSAKTTPSAGRPSACSRAKKRENKGSSRNKTGAHFLLSPPTQQPSSSTQGFQTLLSHPREFTAENILAPSSTILKTLAHHQSGKKVHPNIWIPKV
jgi:hypothetical protein